MAVETGIGTRISCTGSGRSSVPKQRLKLILCPKTAYQLILCPKTVHQLILVQDPAVQDWMLLLAGKVKAEVRRCIEQGFLGGFAAAFYYVQVDIRMEFAEAVRHLAVQDAGQPWVAVQVDTASMSGLVRMDMGRHLSLNLKYVTGEVDKYLTCISGFKTVMHPGE